MPSERAGAAAISEALASIACFTTMVITMRRVLPKEDRPVAEYAKITKTPQGVFIWI